MVGTCRIPVNSLLNNDDQQTIPVASSPTTVSENLRFHIALRQDSGTPSITGVSPSPTLSQLSMSSNTSSTTGQLLHRQKSSSGESASGSKHSYRPYDPNQSPRVRRVMREFRPSYDMEESYFIWYHRLDLNLDWNELRVRYNYQFKRQRSGCQGFQCKFYRFLQEHGLPSVRERAKDPNAPRAYALRTWKPDVWYPWMQPTGMLSI